MKQNNLKIYLSPLQGFTDFSFRKIFSELMGGIDSYLIPYISFGKGRAIKKSQLNQILTVNNLSIPVIPQVLFSDPLELIELVSIISDQGYNEINLNLGCPYPMATNKGRGAAWLSKPEELALTLAALYHKNPSVTFSIKMRAGMQDPQECFQILKVLEQFPVNPIFFHPRTAKQMYEGKADPLLFKEARQYSSHPLIYNGDIISETGFQELSAMLPGQNEWMIGRGLLMDPTLALRLKGRSMEEKGRKEKLKEFHDCLFQEYAARLQGGGHLLTKMTQFWSYFSYSFDNQHKTFKLIKKAGSLMKYNAAVAQIFKG